MISDDDLKRWRALCAAATPGPWTIEWDNDEQKGVSRIVGDTARFIAESRTALPRLLDEVEALRASLHEAKDRIDRQRATLKKAFEHRDMLHAVLIEALDGWESLWRSDNNDPPPDEIAELRQRVLAER